MKRARGAMAALIVVLSVSGDSLAAGSGPVIVEAAKARDVGAIRALLADSDVNARQADGSTALHWAAHWNDVETADLLLRAGATAGATNDYGVTPLLLAGSDADRALVEKLLSAGADPNFALPTGETPLMVASRAGKGGAVEALLAAGASVNASERTKGQTALMWAVSEKHAHVVRLLLAGGSDVRAKSTGGFTALLFAAREGDADMIRLLLSSGADVNDTAADGTTALLAATVLGYWDLAGALMDAGADPNAKAAGYAPLHWVAGVWESLMTPEYEHTPLADQMFAVPSPRKLDLIRRLLDKGADPNVQMTKHPPRYGSSLFARNYLVGATPFYLSASAGDVAVMRLLIERGADPSIPASDGTTALSVAAGLTYLESESVQTEEHHLAAVKLCIDLGLQVRTSNKGGDSPLHGAAFAGFNSVVELLVASGAEMTAKNSGGFTPLGVADGGRCCTSNFMMVYKQERTAALLRRLGAR